jgi:hypothetical protein
MHKTRRVCDWRRAPISSLIGIVCIVLSVPSWGRGRADKVASSPGLANSPDSREGQIKIPPGTILPVRLRTTLNPEKLRQGQAIRGEIAQEYRCREQRISREVVGWKGRSSK